MATLEDKILGEKLQNYCSSSEDEDGSDDENYSDCSDGTGKTCSNAPAPELPKPNKWNGTASNTGPKGVIEDWRKYKQLEAENRDEENKERIALAKKFTLSCRTNQEDEAAKKQEELEDELLEIANDDFFLNYQKQRMQEILSQLKRLPHFGKLQNLQSKEEFLNAIDKEIETVTVIVHVFSSGFIACRAMDGCLAVLAKEYPTVKFCRVSADVTGMSRNFRDEGVPALLVYKAGQIVGNFVKMSGELGEDFFAVDVERFLSEYGLLPEKEISSG